MVRDPAGAARLTLSDRHMWQSLLEACCRKGRITAALQARPSPHLMAPEGFVHCEHQCRAAMHLKGSSCIAAALLIPHEDHARMVNKAE